MSQNEIGDWTTGAEAIAYQHCACGHLQYFKRAFCASCGAADPPMRTASGEGVIYALTHVHRAATPEARAHLPYTIVLADMAEGFRMMAHGAADLTIGDAVTARFTNFTDRIVPYFERTIP